MGAVAQHGQQAARQLYALFEHEWDGDETRAYWPAEVQRRILLACYRAGIEREQIKVAIIQALLAVLVALFVVGAFAVVSFAPAQGRPQGAQF